MKRRASILIIEDDREAGNMPTAHLATFGYFDTMLANSGAGAIAVVKDFDPDVILLDAHLPDVDGRDLCRLLRKRGVEAPVILIAGAATDADIILGLDAGANDYLIRPFGLGVLLARIRVQLR